MVDGTLMTEYRTQGGVAMPGRPAFVGRDAELATLSQAVAGGEVVALVEGETGIGKSRLVAEFLAISATRAGAGAGRTLVACCPPLRTPCTLGPVVDALRQAVGSVRGLVRSGLAGALRPLFPEWADDLPPAPEPAPDATAARHRLFAALAELLAELNMVLLVVEDVHWADEATMEFLLFLASRQPRRASLVITCRPEDVPAGSLMPRLTRLAAGSRGLRLALGPLDLSQTSSLVSSMLDGQAIAGEFAAFLHERTDGVPLALEETIRLLHQRSDLIFRRSRWMRHDLAQIEIPPTVKEAVLERADRLSADAGLILRSAAVLDAPAGEAMLAAVTRLSAVRVRAGLSQALRCGLLEEGGPNAPGMTSFRHAFAKQALYDTIPGPERRILHQRAGLALEQCYPLALARLARHFHEAGDDARWHRYGEQVADLALAVGDDATAVFVLHALVTGARLQPREVVRLSSRIMLTVFPSESQLKDLAAALRSAQETADLTLRERAEARFNLGRVLVAMDEGDQAHAELERALAHLPHGSLEAVRAMTLLGHPFSADGPASQHLRWLRSSAGLIGILQPAEQTRLHLDRAAALLALGEQEGWAEAERITAKAPEPTERLHVTRGQGNLGEAAIIWGRYDEARRRLQNSAELAVRYGYSRLRDSASVNLVHLDWFSGAWDGLAARAARLVADEDIEPSIRREAFLVEGLLQTALGTRDQAREHLERVVGETSGQVAVFYMMEPAAALAMLRLADGDAEEALRITERPCQVVARKGTWLWGTEVVPARLAALAAAGRLAEAKELTVAFARGLRGRDAPAPRAAQVSCRAMLAEARGDHARAAALFGRAAAAWQALPRPYDELLARERQARNLRAADRSDDGLSLLAEVSRGLSVLGATFDAARVTKVLRDHGVKPVTGRAGRRSYGKQLSPRELEVLRLLVAGRSVREIADELFLSPKTVDCHVDAARRKLRAPSRIALAAVAVQAGIVSSERGS